MVKSVKTSSTIADSPANAKKKEVTPTSQFIGAALSMSWQLAIVVLLPILGGYKLDQHFNSLPLWTIFGFILAMVGTFVIIKKVLGDFDDNLKKQDKK